MGKYKWILIAMCALLTGIFACVPGMAQNEVIEEHVPDVLTDASEIDKATELRLARELLSLADIGYYGNDSAYLQYFLNMHPLRDYLNGLAMYVHQSFHVAMSNINAPYNYDNYRYYPNISDTHQIDMSKHTKPNYNCIAEYVGNVNIDEFDRIFVLHSNRDQGKNGIYDLLEAFVGYYQEILLVTNIIPSLDTIRYFDKGNFYNSLPYVYNNQELAYYKLKTYIAYYLLYLRTNNLPLWDFLQSDRTFAQYFTLIDEQYTSCLRLYKEYLEENDSKTEYSNALKYQKSIFFPVEYAKQVYHSKDIQNELMLLR